METEEITALNYVSSEKSSGLTEIIGMSALDIIIYGT